MKQDELLKLENQICFPMYVASRMITRAYQPMLDVMGITYPQYLVLMALWEKDEQTVNEIGQQLYLNTNTITPLLKRMEKTGIVVRTRSKKDERKVMITLTPAGQALKEQAYCIPEQILNKTGLPIEGISQLKQQIYGLIRQMEKIEQQEG
ncbi:MarR family winged helix-turn-helix transcriptional regulator [Microscilla marina]|uniref:Transcriptional regulator n=1 Tax=Microscilla marina ATCC 23134 TaxID=313606 RepID=A1ZNP5_MICM2|nr:MarR family transcriptional regulator [Microscilla marina]EAY27934.1 transcriptional regulator [Microscilla marina ATCC 23134]